ncbi:MAG TPA: ATP-binding protein, partial [Acidimicrobiales bacterium]|nr:ATP-binding protein [Acidimicrobiales bacterium]
MVAHSAVCPVQVGRDRERAVLAGNAGRRTTTLISGPAGVGKSRLVGEAVRAAEELGMSALLGH